MCGVKGRGLGSSRFRIQAFDRKGNKFTVSFEGKVSRDKVLQVLDMVELLGGLPPENKRYQDQSGVEPPTKLDKVRSVIIETFMAGWFSSKDIKVYYEESYGETITLSTISTYLQRLAVEGFLLRSGSRAARRYRLNAPPEKGVLRGPDKVLRNPSALRP